MWTAANRALKRIGSIVVSSDPSFGRLRMATRVTLTLIANVGVLYVIHGFLPLSVSAYGISVITALQGALQIKDATATKRLVTRFYCAMAGFGAAAVAALLSHYALMADATFLALVFVAVYGRKYGVRWNAVGMFAFMCYFLGCYLRPSTSDLPGIAISIAISGAVAHLIRITVLPERPAEEFARAARAVFERIGELKQILRAGDREGWSESRRQAAHHAQDRIGEALLIADSYLPISEGEIATDDPGRRLAIELFDLHLASETAMLAALDARDSPGDRTQAIHLETALTRLDRLTEKARQAVKSLPPAVFEREPLPAAPKTSGTKSGGFLKDPALRLAVQVLLASAIAMTGGLLVSKTRWFWAILTAFLVFVNTQSRGDTAIRALNRTLGTLGGIVIGIALATLLHGAFLPSAVFIVALTFVGFYLLQLSYGAMTFCVTIVLSLLYGLLGEFTPGLLILRLEETVIGTLAGTFISFAVFPQTTTAAADKAADAYLSALDRVLSTADASLEKDRRGTTILALSRHLDRRLADLNMAARPLGANWNIVRHPGTVRQALLRFAALTYWTRTFAKDLAATPLDEESRAALSRSIKGLRARIGAARSARIHFLDQATGSEATKASSVRRFSEIDAETDDPLLALDVMARLVTRLSPDSATAIPESDAKAAERLDS